MIHALKKYTTIPCSELSKYIREYNIENSFNPSICIHNDVTYIAFRGKSKNNKHGFDALLLTINKNKNKNLINLSDKASNYNITPVSDPKLVILNNNVWITFNTGWSNGNNNIYLWKITPNIERPICCHYKERQPVEKNWGFFINNDKLMALYSIENKQILVADIPNDKTQEIKFTELSKSINNNKLKGYSIGTQPIKFDGSYHLIAHKKFNIWKKRLYLGRLISFRMDDSSIKQMTSAKHFLIHSFRSLLGTKIKHNKNLISCTYFSGLLHINESIFLSYGINDIDFNIVEVSKESL